MHRALPPDGTHFTGNQFVVVGFGLLHRPGDERVGCHATTRRFGHRSLLLRRLPRPRLILALAQIGAQGRRLALLPRGQLRGRGAGRGGLRGLRALVVHGMNGLPARRRRRQASSSSSSSVGIALWIGNGGSPSVVSDWANVAEEIEDVGRSELRSCRSLLRQALRHMLKAEAWPLSRDAPTWRADAIDFRRQARDAFAPSMRQKIHAGHRRVQVLFRYIVPVRVC
jgi:Domain of unknown function DUF29